MRGARLATAAVSWLVLAATMVSASESVAVIDISKLDRQPAAIYNPVPKYPHELVLGKINGNAMISFLCRTDGSVDDVQVVSASAPAFGRAGVEAISHWRFRPGRY